MRLTNAIPSEDLISVRRQNEQRLLESIEQEKQREAQVTQRRAEWTANELKLCTECLLPLDDVSIAQITANPMQRHEHPFCNSFELEAGVARGLAKLLSEAYGDGIVPLESLRKVVEIYRNQRGFCAVSRIRLTFPEPEGQTPVVETRPSYSTALSSFENEIIRHQHDKEETQHKRHSELHSAVLDYSEDGKLRLISKTVARWKEGLEDSEFADLVRTLNSELHSAFPESRSFNPAAVGRLSMNRHFVR